MARGDIGMRVDFMLSIAISQISQAIPNDCYCNAWEVTAKHLHEESFYVEGWIVVNLYNEIQIIEHGWCVLPDRIIDPTIIFLTNSSEVVSYFPGVQYSYEETLAFEGELLPQVRFTRYGNDGMLHPEYKKAFEDAHAHARELDKRIVVYTAKYEEERIR
jgi:hypothetical protein